MPLAGIALGIGAVLAFNLGAFGVALLGPMPGGSLHLALPTTLSWEDWTTLVPGSAGVAVLTFCSAMAAGRSFAAKNGYTINANRDFIALGLANISSGLTRGFCISGADSRTAINDSVKGRTQIVGIVSALATAAVLLFFTAPLANVPNCALGAVLIFAGVGLIGAGSFGPMIGEHLRRVATDVRAVEIKDSGHWVAEEQPDTVASALLEFLPPPE